MRVLEQISLLVTVVCFPSSPVTSVYAEVAARLHLLPHKERAACIVLYVNGSLFVCVLHMSITPSFNPSLCLGSGTFPVACVQGLAARVAVKGPNLQQACSSATRCFQCICMANTIKVLDIPALHMHGFIASHNKRQVFEWHVACRAFPKNQQVFVCVLHS